MNGHCSFRTCAEGLRRDLPPMVLFEKAKKLGIWNPSDIDFTQDVCDWHRLSGPQQDMLLRLTALFVAGEEAVTADLLPLIQVIAAQGHVEEELFLTAFLWEEAKHVDFFSRFLAEVCGQPLNLQRYHGRHYTALICRTLPEALGALNATPTSPALVRA
ncbi:MAG: ribonucleotide-diphosphate reductase subunit beta, partial [Candidatus Hydrogenedentes bacterium]|nr:ribonucleotide-diphosphate reductase subunit beta [Candidatus Hydrogenedentota bacterium]